MNANGNQVFELRQLSSLLSLSYVEFSRTVCVLTLGECHSLCLLPSRVSSSKETLASAAREMFHLNPAHPLSE